MRALGCRSRPRLACTVVSKSYLAYARVLARSFLAHEPAARVVVLLLDRVDGAFDPAAEPFEVVLAESLGNIPARERFFFQYTVLELATAIKPYFLEWLFAREGECDVVFLDPDILVLQSFAPLWDLLAARSPVLTPHLLAPIEDERLPGELEILRAGLYNLGFLALREGPSTQRLLSWWQRRLYRGCLMDPGRGMHVDQKWMDLIPLYFEEAAVLRDPGWNVAYWNLAERALCERDGALHAGSSPVRFFHFSGFDTERPESISCHQDRFVLGDLPQLHGLFAEYRRLLLEAGHAQTCAFDYAFGRFQDGARIPEAARRVYFALGAAAERFGDPFCGSGPASFRHWLCEPLAAGGGSQLTHALHRARADLVAAFPDPRGADAAGFLDWLRHTGVREFPLDPVLLPPLVAGSAAAAPAREPRRLPRAVRALAACVPRLRAHVRRRLLLRRRTAAASPRPFGINLAGYAASEKGIGEALRAQLRTLEVLGLPVALHEVRDAGSDNREALLRPLCTDAPYAINLVHVNADQLPAFAARVGPAWFAGRHTIGVWYWELAQFPACWLEHAAPLDEVWVASPFIQDALSRVLPVPVVCVPPALELEPQLRPLTRAQLGWPEGAFVFLFVFDMASYAERKNPLGLIRAFRRAFAPGERVELVIKLARPQFAPAATDELRAAAAEAGVRLVESLLPRPALLGLIAACDAYVSLHRSEGFGLTLAEAMALGRPVIATGYSGNLEFMTPENSLLVDYELVELAEDVGPYPKGARWAEPRLEHAVHCLRRLAGDRAFAAALGERGRQEVRARLAPKAVAARVSDRLRTIVRARGELAQGAGRDFGRFGAAGRG